MQLLSQSRQFFFFNDTATTEIYTLSYTTLFRSVPDRGRAAAGQPVDHLLVQLPLRREALAGRNLADIAVVRGTRRVVIQENRPASPPRPGLELYRVQVRNVERADDLQPLVAHPVRVRRLFLGDELVREFF